jgi:hypothetical protein
MAKSPTLLLVLCASVALAQPPAGPETLRYAVEWRLIPAGTARLSYTPLARSTAPIATQAASEVRLHLESAGLVSRLFRVEDDYTAMLGQNLCAQNEFMSAHEGSRNKETRVVFDPATRKGTWIEKDLVKKVTATKEVEVPACVHDILGGLMLLRTLKLEPGKTAHIPLSDGKKFVQVRIEAQEREDLKTELGILKTVKYEIFLFNNVLYKRPGHVHIWLADDDKRTPVQLQVRMQFAIGTITFRLLKPSEPGTGDKSGDK